MEIPVRVEGELTIPLDALEPQALAQIKSALTVPNEDRETRAAENIWGWWDLPETINLWRVEERRGGAQVICLPRGFAAGLTAGLGGMGHTVAWEDHRARVEASPGYFQPFTLRDYQLDAVLALLAAEQGFYECPAGGGKTVTMLGLMAYARQRSMVIVDKAGLVEQWRERAATYLGLSLDPEDPRGVGKIGEDVWIERDLTIALRQTLWARLWELDATKWWATWGLTLYDEGHHLAADTLAEISRKTVSALMLATSATPAKSPTKGLVVHSLIGPIVHSTPRKLLYERGVLMQPTVERVPTGFQAEFWPTHDSDQTGKCQVEGCRKAGTKHGHRNNYSSVLKKLTESKERNELIAQRVVSERGHIHLIPSRQLKHLDALKKAIEKAGWDGPIFYLRGEENARGESQEIAQAAEAAHEAVILSTVADEGLDIPPIDRVHIVFPMKQDAAVIQLIGRGERVAPNKTDSVIVDYTDSVNVFQAHAEERERVFRMQGYAIRQHQVPEIGNSLMTKERS